MESWEETLKELQSEFIRESGARLNAVVGLLDLLEREPNDNGRLRDLMRRFHAFGGSGSTYGFPRVSALGLEGERECAERLRAGLRPTTSDLVRWRGIVEGLRREFSGPAALGEAPPTSAPPAAEGFEVLVVDDDEEARGALARLVTQEGMSVRSACTRAEAVREIEARLPDGLITDIRLPDGSGYELVNHLRSLPGGEAPAVVVLSHVAGFLDKVEAIHCGADGYFEKPVDWEALMRRLQHLLERNQAPSARILYVEDDPPQAAFVKLVLQSAAYEVHICDDPARFEADLLAFRPDLVLVDIGLPGISGYDLVRYLRQDERYATLPALFLTTEGRLQARIETARAGGDDHLLKPVPSPLLLSAVAARLERSRFLKGLLDRDGLTRLLAHTAFLERARAVVAQSQRNPERSAAWVMLDLDHFKEINDGHGHPVGDRVLTSLSALLRRRLRQSDTIGRYGGEEFAILFDDLKEEEAVRLVSRLREEFASLEHVAPDGSLFNTTFSAGVAMLEPGSMDLEGWRQAADDALYAAKAAGRNRVVAASAGSFPPIASPS